MFQKTFTLSEARAMLPQLREMLVYLREEQLLLVRMQPEMNLARAKANLDGGSPFGELYLERAFRFTEILDRIEKTGVLVKDFQKGLIDFPHEHEGRIVFLCWKPDEDELEWWHEVEDGFSGRQPIGEAFERSN